jgi:hypothetical protein
VKRRWAVRSALGAACVLLCAGPAGADEMSDAELTELGEMRALVLELRQQVDAQAEQIEAQGNAIHEAREREAKRGNLSGLDPFFSSIEIGGWVATSWWYNFNDPPGHALTGANQGAGGAFYPFHPDSNSFEVDQVWFEMEKPVTEDSRAGFRLDMVYGLTAAQLGGA